MKFGQNLHRHQVVEWTPSYIDYQALKQSYKRAQKHAPDHGEDIDLRDFRLLLAKNLSKCRAFYEVQHAFLALKRKKLYGHYNVTAVTDLNHASGLEISDLRRACVELQAEFKRLLWFWLVNFDKIIGTLAKFQEDVTLADSDLTMRARTIGELNKVNDGLAQLAIESKSIGDQSAQATLPKRKHLREGFDSAPWEAAIDAIRREDTGCLDQELGHIGDGEGLTPLDIAVLDSNATIVETLIEDHRRRLEAVRSERKLSTILKPLPGHVLAYAIRLDSLKILQLLSKSCIEFNHSDYSGDPLLHLAVRMGKPEYVKEIIRAHLGSHGADVNTKEAVYGRTSLMIASAMGELALVELLLGAGSDPMIVDDRGWRAEDHAAFKGWLPLASKLTALTAEHTNSREVADSFDGRRLPTGKPHRSSGLTRQRRERISSDQSHIYVILGALDTYAPVVAVDLSPYVSPDTFNPQRQADFYVEIQAIGGDEARYTINLPIMEDMSNQPWRFLTNNPRDFKIAFNIHYSEISGRRGDTHVGTAVALLDNLKQGLGTARESLIRNFAIPILQKDSLKFIGTVTFYFQIVTPFPHPAPKRVTKQVLAFLNPNGLPIIGHRGTGQNDPSRRQLQIGENTIEAFLSAKDFGASYVEFDVQLTKDDIPIIYHDFLMSETGIDAPLHILNLEQFMHISDVQSQEESNLSKAEKRYSDRCSNPTDSQHRPRSQSLDVYDQSRARTLIERMKHTFEFKLNEPKGFDSYKGNIRSQHIQAPFATLEDLLTKLPETVGFDIEIKYPMLFEAHDWGMETSAVEVNRVVDSTLDRVYRLGNERQMFFSSFSPEVCILLSTKQDIYPVFFLTEAGHIPSSDARADSLQEAIWFARSWRLAGVISRSQPLVISPKLIRYVQDAGLLCISWGDLNNVAEYAKSQVDAGLDAIITDSVNLVSKALK